MDTSPIDVPNPRAILRKVGKVLIVAGLVSIAWMLYALSLGFDYWSVFNISAVIAGVFLRNNSLRTARYVRTSAAATFASTLGLLVVLPVIFPVALIRTYLRIAPAVQWVSWGISLLAGLALLWWVHRSLSAAPVEAAIQAAALRGSHFWHAPGSGFFMGAGLVAIIAIFVPMTNQSENAKKTIEQARTRYGPGYHFFVTSLSSTWTSNSGTYVTATVIAYTDSSIESVEIEWHE